MNDGAPREAKADLESILRHVWERLEEGAGSAADPYRVAALSTVADGAPKVRSVVLRRVLTSERRILCHTDLRSPKVAEIRAHPRVAWLFYDPDRKEQVRVEGSAQVRTAGPLADGQWDRTGDWGRRCYLAPEPPSSPAGEAFPNLPAELLTRAPTPAESEGGRARFAVIDCLVDRLDWLALHSRGHERAGFRWEDGGWQSGWLAP